MSEAEKPTLVMFQDKFSSGTAALQGLCCKCVNWSVQHVAMFQSSSHVMCFFISNIRVSRVLLRRML